MKNTSINRVDSNGARWYETPIGRCPSATTVLRVLAKPALIAWSAKRAAEYMRRVLMDIQSGAIPPEALTDKEIERMVRAAKAAHKEESRTAMDIGSAVHAWIEIYYKMKLSKKFESVPGLTPQIQAAIDAFRAWDAENKVVPICVEERIWSVERFAGTLDLYAEVAGVLTLVDFKSSTGHWDDHVLQLGAYDLAFRERTGRRVDGYMIVRLDKTTGMPDPRSYSREEVELGAKKFLAALSYFWLCEGGKHD